MLANFLGRDIDPDVDSTPDLNTLGDQLFDSPLYDGLRDLEIRDAEADQSARGFIPLEECHRVTGASELLGSSHSGRPGANDRHTQTRFTLGWLRSDPPLFPGAFDDRLFNLLDRYGIVLADLEYAGRFTGRRAELAREFREVVGRVELVNRVLPPVPVDEVIPVGDEVAERAAVVAEGDPAVHASPALLGELLGSPGDHELPEVTHPFAGVPIGDACLVDFEKPSELAHLSPRSRPLR